MINAELFKQNAFKSFEADASVVCTDSSKPCREQVGNENGRDKRERKGEPEIQIVQHVVDLIVFDRIGDLLQNHEFLGHKRYVVVDPTLLDQRDFALEIGHRLAGLDKTQIPIVGAVCWIGGRTEETFFC